MTQEFSFKNLPKDQIAASVMIVCFAVFMIWDQIHWWRLRDDYSFGFLVPFFAAYVVYDRWPVIRSFLFRGARPNAIVPVVSGPGLIVRLTESVAVGAFFTGLLLFGVGALLRAVSGPQNPASLAIAAGFAGLMLSTVFLFSKERADGKPMAFKARLALVALFIFPALIWLISAPLASFLEDRIKVFLLTKVTIVVFTIFDVLGYDLERQGNVLILPDGQVGVEEACSGILSLMACLFAGSFLAAVFLNKFWKKVSLVFAAMIMAVITNMMRSLFLTLWAYKNGSGAINDHWVLPIIGDIGSVHDVAGFAILGVTCIGLICLLPVFNYQPSAFDDDEAYDSGDYDDEATEELSR